MESPYMADLRKRVKAARQLQADLVKYDAWIDGELKDCQVNFRLAKADLMRLKSMARARNMKYQTFLREIIRKALHPDESADLQSRSVRVRDPY